MKERSAVEAPIPLKCLENLLTAAAFNPGVSRRLIAGIKLSRMADQDVFDLAACLLLIVDDRVLILQRWRLVRLRFGCLFRCSQLRILLLHLELFSVFDFRVAEHEVPQLLLLLLQELLVRALQGLRAILEFFFAGQHPSVEVEEVLFLSKASDVAEQLALLHAVLGPVVWPFVAFEGASGDVLEVLRHLLLLRRLIPDLIA